MMTEKEKFLHSVLWHHSAVKQASRRTENQTWLPAGGMPVKVTVESQRGEEVKRGVDGANRKVALQTPFLLPFQIKSSDERDLKNIFNHNTFCDNHIFCTLNSFLLCILDNFTFSMLKIHNISFVLITCCFQFQMVKLMCAWLCEAILNVFLKVGLK